jgi:hypothetical protein
VHYVCNFYYHVSSFEKPTDYVTVVAEVSQRNLVELHVTRTIAQSIKKSCRDIMSGREKCNHNVGVRSNEKLIDQR